MNMWEKGKYDFDFAGRPVLVVEDNAMSFRLISAALSRVNVTLTHASNGKVAVELCQGEKPFDVVIMDLQMPEMNGLDATREIKKIRPGLPVIAATASTFEDELERCREAGCDSFITKPFKFQRLFELMQSYFDRQT